MRNNDIRLSGRRAVVTGGASGIGHAISTRLIASGAVVALWDMGERTPSVASYIGAEFGAVVDIRDYAGVERARDRTIAALGGIDILVNSAGITGPNAPTWEYPLDAWRDVLDVNLTGTFHCCRAVVPTMRAQTYGRIVNIASVAGKDGNPNAPAYSASKAGVIGLTKSLGKELADTNVCVNCITPAAVQTPIFEQMTAAHIDFMRSKIPMGRFGEPAEIAALVAWLCSDECSFSTAAVFDLSGGRSTY